MGLRLLGSAAVTGAALIALAACSDGEETDAVESLADPTMEATAIATMEPPGEVVPPAIAATVDIPEPAVATHQPTPAPTFTLEFPNDIAMLVSVSLPPPPNVTEAWPRMEPARIYREDGDGEVVMEKLFSAPLPWEQECTGYFPVDASELQAFVGQLPECSGYYSLGLNAKLGPDGEPDVSSIIM